MRKIRMGAEPVFLSHQLSGAIRPLILAITKTN